MDSAGNWFKIASLLFAAASVGIGARNILPTPTAEPHRLPQVAADAQPIPDPPQLRRLPPVLNSMANAEHAIRDHSVRPASHDLLIGTQVVRTAVAAPEPFSSAAITLTNVDGTRSSHTITESHRFRTKDATISISSTVPSAFNKDNHLIALDIDGARQVFAPLAANTFESGNLTLSDRVHQLRLLAVEKADSRIEVPLVTPITFAVAVRTSKIRVIDVDQSGFAFVKPPYHLKLVFDTSEIESIATSMFNLFPLSADAVPGTPIAFSDATMIPNTGGVQLVLTGELSPGNYLLRINGGTTANCIQDVYGNVLEGNKGDNYEVIILKPIGGEVPSVLPGISGPSGPYVPFKEFAPPRDVPNGFNPNDKVETRVVRLYYYRDAHRVAQIINRKVRSYNRVGVDMQRQLADKARTVADQSMDARQFAERNAIIVAQKTREAEHKLTGLEQNLTRSIQELSSLRLSAPDTATDDPKLIALTNVVKSFGTQVEAARTEVAELRNQHVEANNRLAMAEAKERTARDEQFRREVAAAHADPDTYAPGVPASDDPVEQVSVSVIGEGLIHLRGPLKGINQIRTMIDQIDQPVGQVRVSVHSVQINGERAERMEEVAFLIQRYIDHARFLTMQCSEMLRKSVVQVAARKAEEAMAQYPGETQEDRDRRYLYSFFGKDFIDELDTLDSEFLRTGNKLLSLHSMDTTSLSTALNLMALAKNSTRMEILQQFDELCQAELPRAEQSYLEASMSECKQKHHGCQPQFCLMADNARFESLRGFFNTEMVHDDTLSPLQREFIRLAQIFKGRLITELEYKQRVMERAIIEERVGDRQKQLDEAFQKELAAKQELEKVSRDLSQAQINMSLALTSALAEIVSADDNVIKVYQDSEPARQLIAQLDSASARKAMLEIERRIDNKNMPVPTNSVTATTRASIVPFNDQRVVYEPVFVNGELRLVSQASDPEEAKVENGRLLRLFREALIQERRMFDWLSDYAYPAQTQAGISAADEELKALDKYSKTEIDPRDLSSVAHEHALTVERVKQAASVLRQLMSMHNALRAERGSFEKAGNEILQHLLDIPHNLARIRNDWESLARQITAFYGTHSNKLKVIESLARVSPHLTKIQETAVRYKFADQTAERSRRPLDHKKFLDMLIDDLEEKYIELLDGTRAHTANVDNYLKRITTALDDDFNTQFYYPSFRHIREASTYYDVQFGQTETTTVLANNREFAKVEPNATMEFDLPPRDILLTEAMNGAKAMIDDVGALANDPTFLAMTRMNANGSGSSPAPGSTGGFGTVRDVLPGLETSTAEHVMAHNAAARPQFGANLENLIPDPAIYKFETGTGFEIRPVIQPDGQAVVYDFNYMYTTNIREPVRADEKHLGRVKRHYVHTDVQLSNFELREVSRYTVALKAARTAKGVPLLEDMPVVGVMFRPLPSDESSLQQNIILNQATIFPTLFDLMGLRWAPAVSDMDPLRLSNEEFVVRGRHRELQNRVYDYASNQVDEFLRIPEGNRRSDLYRTQESVPRLHPNGYQGPGLDLRESAMQEGYRPNDTYTPDRYVPSQSKEGAPFRGGRNYGMPADTRVEPYPLEEVMPRSAEPTPTLEPPSSRRVRP